MPNRPAAQPAALRRALLDFFDAHRRDLPWRRTGDPYAIWVSEVMLQQTRVDAVVPYFRRWMERFPTVGALAEAPEGEVLKAWEGLGYYSRARNLHGAARLVRERHGGVVPAEREPFLALPGVGDYTAGAVGSIAFGRAEPAVDGNVRRVLSRLYDLEDASPAEVRRRAASLVPDERPGDFNQALMELGATVCTPRSPACPACPLSAHCLGRARGTVELRPPAKAKRAVPEDTVATGVFVSPGARVLLVRRPARGLLGGLWELPGVALPTGARAGAAVAALGARLGLGEVTDAGDDGRPLDDVVHVFTHRRTTYRPVLLALAEERAPALPRPSSRKVRGSSAADGWTAAAWVRVEELEAFALPVAQRRIAVAALAREADKAAQPTLSSGAPSRDVRSS